jgi:methyl-accepting chemotaxis protein
VAEGDFRGTLEVNSSDEIGELAGSFRGLMDQLREVLLVLDASAGELEHAASQLSEDAAAQNRTATRQASALYETQVTAQELQRSSQTAAQRAQTVLKGVERADSLGLAGEKAIESSVGGLTMIRDQVDQIAHTSQELQQRTTQIGGITQTVKDLADQSNMLALNAAIESVRSGEHGKGFGVVAREIRALADQSIQATSRVRELLDDISASVAAAVRITERGAERMESGLAQVRTSGKNLKELSNIVQDNAAAVRQIAAAVNQQNVGISQITQAVNELSKMMDETVARIGSTGEAATTLQIISEQLSSAVKSYRVE